MPNEIGIQIFDNSNLSTMTQLPLFPKFFIALAVSLVIGLLISASYMFRNRYTKSFVATLTMIPIVVCAVIFIINHDIGAGIAVAGAFSLVRFRSLPGTAKELGMLFLSMGAGLIAGMGQFVLALVFTVLLCIIFLAFNHIQIGSKGAHSVYRTLNITIPEDLDYTTIFDDLLQVYTTSYELARVKTTNMGSMFRLTYSITLRDVKLEKSFIDQLRCRNGNLEITVSKQETIGAEL